MKRLPIREFRRREGSLPKDEVIEVTSYGKVIGSWVPSGMSPTVYVREPDELVREDPEDDDEDDDEDAEPTMIITRVTLPPAPRVTIYKQVRRSFVAQDQSRRMSLLEALGGPR